MKVLPRNYRQSARAASAEATGQRIVEAFLKRLMSQWFDEITLDAVAEDASVTVQTVVRRFGGKDGLLSKAVQILGTDINAQRAAPPGDIDRVVDNLLADYEKTGDTVIRLLALEPRHTALKTVLDLGRNEHRQWAGSAFAEVLKHLEAGDRQRALDSMVIATDVYTWKLLRRDMGRSVRATAVIMKDLIQRVIS